jgi:hypothetical protein
MTLGRGRLGSRSLRDPTLSSPSYFCKLTVQAFNHLMVKVEPWFLFILKINWIKLFAIISLPWIPLTLSKLKIKILGRNLVSMDKLSLFIGNTVFLSIYLDLKLIINFIDFIV